MDRILCDLIIMWQFLSCRYHQNWEVVIFEFPVLALHKVFDLKFYMNLFIVHQ